MAITFKWFYCHWNHYTPNGCKLPVLHKNTYNGCVAPSLVRPELRLSYFFLISRSFVSDSRTRISITVPPDLKVQLEALAQFPYKSVANAAVVLMLESLERRDKKEELFFVDLVESLPKLSKKQLLEICLKALEQLNLSIDSITGIETTQLTIPNLLQAYLLLNYQKSSDRITDFANDCSVTVEQIKAALEERPICEDTAGVLAAKLGLSFDEFLEQFPAVVRDCEHLQKEIKPTPTPQ